MSYQIIKSDSELLLVLADGTTDNVSSSLTFVGKNVSKFGEIQNTNFLHLLENFAATNEPAYKLTGQLWFDKTINVLKVYDSVKWQKLSTLDYSDTTPLGSPVSTLWYKTDTGQLFIKTGVDYTLIAPEDAPDFPDTKFISLALKDTSDVLHPVIECLVDGEVQYVISKDDFVTSSTNLISDIPRVYTGITYKNGTTYGSSSGSIVGTSLFATNAGTLRNQANTAFIPASTLSTADTIVQRTSQGGANFSSITVSSITTSSGTISGVWTVTDGLKPDINNGAYLGTSSLRWNEVYVSTIDATVVDADTVKFTALTDPNLRSISQFDIDPALAANSDARLATQKAIKRYIDNAVAAEISLRIAGDSNLQTQINNVSIPVGMVLYTASNTVPAGFLAANGQTVSKNTYLALYTALGGENSPYGESEDNNFKLPDLRGEFIRGWDNGRGVDLGRTAGSRQDDQFEFHTHAATVTDPGHLHTFRDVAASSGDRTDPYGSSDGRLGTSLTSTATTGITIANASTGSTETRPRNVALLAIIKF